MPESTAQPARKRGRIRKLAIWGVGTLVLVALAAALFWRSYQEQLLNREVISGVLMMRHVGVAVIRADDGDSDLIDARRALLSNPEVMQTVCDHYRRWDREALPTLTMGGVSMERLLEDEQLRGAIAAALPAANADWLAIGPLMICQRRDHYSGRPSNADPSALIIAYVADTVRPDWWYVARADGSGQWLHTDRSAESWRTLGHDSAVRAASGLPPLPMPNE